MLITMPPLAATDAAATQKGLTRAGLIRQAVLDWLARQSRPRKKARDHHGSLPSKDTFEASATGS